MKAKRWNAGVWMGLGVWCVVQIGCGVVSEEPSAPKSTQGGLLGEMPRTEMRTKTALSGSSQIQVQNAIGNQQVLAKGARYRRLYPVGLWKGSLTYADKSVSSMTLDLRGKEGAALRATPRKVLAPRSVWSTLFGTAHACGPYGEEMRVAAVGRWSVASSQLGGALEGDIVSYDDFQYSAGFNSRNEGILLNGSVYMDHKTQKRKLAGSVMQENTAVNGQKSYKHIGNFELGMVEESQPL